MGRRFGLFASAIDRVALALVVLCLVWLGGRGFLAVERLGDGLSRTTDSFSEAGTVRAGEGFATQGFLHDRGLPDIAYGNRFPADGWKSMNPGMTREVYTHYPPGPDWITGAMTVACGPGRLGCMRLAPLSFSLLCMAWLAWVLVRELGPVRAAFVQGVLTVTPVVGGWMFGLYYQAYAFALLLLQLGVLLQAFRPGGRLGRGHSLALVALGFLQGWLSFDYFFLTSLTAWPMWLLLPAAERTARRRELLWACALPAAGFAFAHGLHLLQVAVWLGSVGAAIEDLRAAAVKRASSSVGLWEVTWLYFRGVIVDPAGFQFRLFLAVTAALGALAWRHVWQPRRSGQPIDQAGLRQGLAVLAAGLIIAGLWTVVMRQHAKIHYFFLVRHYFVVLFLALLVLVDRVAGLRPAPVSPRPPSA